MAKKNTTDLSFEKYLNKLETIVKKMETGNLTLEQSLKQFESGIELTRKCQHILSKSQQRVEILIEENDSLFTQPFELEEDEALDAFNDEDE